MNEYRFPWKTAAVMAALAIVVRRLSTPHRASPQARGLTPLRPLQNAWHEVRGCRMFSRYGSPAWASASPAVVLLHGFGMSGDYLMPLAQRLAFDHAVHLPDLPAHGRSDSTLHAMDIPDQASMLLEWMDSAGIATAFLAAHSMGAQIAIEAARRQPQRFRGLILIGPTRDPQAGLMRHAWRLLKTARFERLSLFGIVTRDYLRMGWRLLSECRAMLRDPVADKAEQLALPVMLIKGEHDAIVPADWLACLGRATRAEEILVIRGGGHAVHHSVPDEVADAVRAFLHRTEGKKGGQMEGQMEEGRENGG